MTKTKKIVLIGPESTGKSTLTKQLAEYFSVPYVSEIAREYILNLNIPYTYKDVIRIAELQIETENKILNLNHDLVFFDTDLIVTKVWLMHCYGKFPHWIDEAIIKTPADLHLLCYYDLLWKPDPLRENPNIRPELFEKYKREITQFGFKFSIIKGFGDERFENAKKVVQKFL
ncbi:MAG TPA: ATP-binding protein [Bacteroidales bacterium]|nr:ATP-binding protein [Bacteroidales bacterium]